ncbi:MAG: hypothetical protein CM1200mP28_11160 [Deltaproteobacteria bacterium]|nr:MAG: hypothetical protein CM1200mP28_11160 [Deltaproteobacteria bacterium]
MGPVRNDPDLKLNDCAVITHDMELYQHEIEQVFESIHDLPYHLIDGISGKGGRLGKCGKYPFRIMLH